jgi:hypothetical protein
MERIFSDAVTISNKAFAIAWLAVVAIMIVIVAVTGTAAKQPLALVILIAFGGIGLQLLEWRTVWQGVADASKQLESVATGP